MTSRSLNHRRREATRRRATLLAAVTAVFLCLVYAAPQTLAHPLGNFTVNRYARLRVGTERVRLRYVVDMAEIAAAQELQKIDTDGDGSPSSAELSRHLESLASQYAASLQLAVDGAALTLSLQTKNISTPEGAGGLPTLRVECDYEAALPSEQAGEAGRLSFEDRNYAERIGWRELVVEADSGISIFNSDAYGDSLTDELRAYPNDLLDAPLDERTAQLSFKRGAAPANSKPLVNRDGRKSVAASRDRLAELIAVPEVTPGVALLALLIAAGLGGLHALSPGHGKTVVGAYLVGSRGTARHAAFLGLTVTVTHTLGVFALGLVTLFASQYILPEKLFPVLSFISGAIVLGIGLSLFIRRLRASLAGQAGGHQHPHAHSHDHAHAQTHTHDQLHSHSHPHTHDDDAFEHASPHAAETATLEHSHGGHAHTHLPPGADGSPVTWRSLLALGVSGGLLPCPSALVVLLSAIALGRVGFGMLLILAFSLGLAGVLTGIGLAFVYAGRMMKRTSVGSGRLVRVLPVVSAFVIACIGALICFEAAEQAGINFGALTGAPDATLSVASVLGFGLILGLKHAVEADHLAAVSTIVSERKSILSASLVGGLWGIGHTISLLVAGAFVIVFRVRISERTELGLEFCVALMLVGLGAHALFKLLRGGRLHLHAHRHAGRWHAHPHIHTATAPDAAETHHGFRLGARPLVVGLVHGLAGSAALMLLVLSSISSAWLGLAYIVVFGVGSIGGMMLMSVLVGLPLHFTARRFVRANLAVRGAAGLFSLLFGLLMVYEIGFVGGLFL